jgi:TM2 domain-containing membrane protein YozV
MAKKGNPAEPKTETRASAMPQRKTSELVYICIAAWLIPGLGHFILGRKGRAGILFACILAMFLLGIGMKGDFFLASTGSYLEALGHLGEMCVGVAMPVARFFGYAGGDPFFASADYGTAFLITAGMLNVLTILDAYDIAMGRKN